MVAGKVLQKKRSLEEEIWDDFCGFETLLEGELTVGPAAQFGQSVKSGGFWGEKVKRPPG